MAEQPPVKSNSHVDSLDILDAAHQNPFEKALRRILNTELAEHTYAEILDGLPTNDSYRDLHYPQAGHPCLQHLELCPGSRERACEFRSGLDITALKFNSSLLLAFEQTIPGTRQFHLRLIELLVVACHQIAVYLFQLDDAIHTHEQYVKWMNEPRDMGRWDSFRAPTAFSHGPYIAIEQYPNGIADAVGYWAEARIFGGVVVFDRGESETECRDVFIHRGGRGGPRTIYPLTAEQFSTLIAFLLDEQGEKEPVKCPFPLLATMKNRWRWDPWDALARFHIFRDRYERRLTPDKPVQRRRFPHDWPELNDELLLVNAVCDRREGLPVDEDKIAAIMETIKQITPSSPLWRDKNKEEEDPESLYGYI